MTVGVGVGDDVAQVATPERERTEPGWHARFIAAFGGAVVIVALILIAMSWSEGLRAATFGDLRADIGQGSVQEWYVADSIDKGDFDRMEARQSTLHDEVVTEDGTTVSNSTSLNGPGEPSGGILVWRTWGDSGWKVATADSEIQGMGGLSAEASEESKAVVKQLRDAGVSMRPYDFFESTGLENLAKLGGLLVLLGLVAGSAPRVGTRWFWFWAMVIGPWFLGFIAYAVMELIGFRRQPDPPLKKRLPGIASFVGAPVLGFLLAVGVDYLRSRGLAFPL
ncbi:hypothetical protein ACOCJ7_13010 [Knoellia sp. CPCC 206453]|uniref:hypothetical protein n=1 Tax=Knoellia pratensis TaxID=3404796 RepID=UPI003620D85C